MTGYKNTQLLFFFVLVAITAGLCFFVLKPFIPTLAIAAIFAVVLTPPHEKLTRFFKGRRGIAATVLTLAVVVASVSLVSFLAANIYQESKDFYSNVQDGETGSIEMIAQTIESRVDNFFPNFKINVPSIADKVFSWTASHLAPLATSTANIFLDVLLATVAILFLLKDGSYLRKSVMYLSPLDDKYDAEILSRLSVTINSVVRGSLLVAAIQGTLAGLGFFIFGIPEAFLWGTVAAVAALIPGIGTSLVLLPGIIYLFLTGETGSSIGLLIWSGVIVGMVDNVLAPYLYGRGSRVHPLLMLLSVIGGVSAFGIAGFIFGPVLMSLAFTLADIYKLMTREKAS